jgi:hypothetical protein
MTPPDDPGGLAAKRRELATYRALRLDRAHKSRAGRRKLEDAKLHLFIGRGTADQPFLKVTRAEYFRLWHECAHEIKTELRHLGLDPETTFPLQQEKHERLVYQRLADDILRTVQSEVEFQRLHGRNMTPHERNLFARTRKIPTSEGTRHAGRVTSIRKLQLENVLQKLERKQQASQTRLQDVWSALVGPSIAAEAFLESVDPEQGLAICRCLNPTRAYELRRRTTLARKLSDALGLNIQRIIFR